MKIIMNSPDIARSGRPTEQFSCQRFSFQFFSFARIALFPRAPHFQVLRSVPMALSGVFCKKLNSLYHGRIYQQPGGGIVSWTRLVRKRAFVMLGLLMMLDGSCSAAGTDLGVFRPGQPWHDTTGAAINAHAGGILAHGGTNYWYGQIMVEGPSAFGSNARVGVSCYSSTNLYDWNNCGVVLAVSDEPGHFLERGCKIERPKVIYNAKTRRFVMWFHHEIKDLAHRNALVGVAVSDSPTGPFTFIKTFRPNANAWPVNVLDGHKTFPKPEAFCEFGGASLPDHPDVLNLVGRDFHRGQMSRDMTLFADDDGKAYHICASEDNSTMHISELTDDYLSPSGKYLRVFINRFMEAPTVFKRNGKYYMINSGCTGWAPNPGRSAVAPSIWGPWEELGNPFVGPESETSFRSQPTFVLPVPGRPNAFIYLGDRWNPSNAVEATFVWLPIEFENEKPILKWRDEWNLNLFPHL